MSESRPGTDTTVSVIVVTYNDEKYIAQAVDSILGQDVDFGYEVIIIDDCSTDRTRDILRTYEGRYPRTVRLVLGDKNRNDSSAWGREILRAQSKYIALLDGDDYWTSPTKLQKQVEFLEIHSECVTCFHNVLCVSEDGGAAFHSNHPSQKEFSGLADLWQGNFISTCSAMFRRSAITELPSWLNTTKLADWAFHILAAQHGRIGYLDEVLGVYRQHRNGVWNRLSRVEQARETMKFYREIDANLRFVHTEPIKRALTLAGRGLRGRIAEDMLAGLVVDACRGVLVLLRYCPAAVLPEFRCNSYAPDHSRYPILPRMLSRCKYLLSSIYPFEKATAQYAGFVDISDSDKIAGWAWDRSWPTCPVAVDIYKGDQLLAKVLADRFREDLRSANVGNGYHAFYYLVPAGLTDVWHSLTVKVAGSDYVLPAQ